MANFKQYGGAGWLKPRRSIKGEEVPWPPHPSDLERKMRTPKYTDGHWVDPETLHEEGGAIFFCGRGVWVDHDVWADGYEEAWGPFVLVFDERKGNACAICKRMRKAWAERPVKARPELPPQWTPEDIQRLLLDDSIAAAQLAAASANVLQMIPGSEVVSG